MSDLSDTLDAMRRRIDDGHVDKVRPHRERVDLLHARGAAMYATLDRHALRIEVDAIASLDADRALALEVVTTIESFLPLIETGFMTVEGALRTLNEKRRCAALQAAARISSGPHEERLRRERVADINAQNAAAERWLNPRRTQVASFDAIETHDYDGRERFR